MELRSPAPRLGEHTHEVLAEAGYSRTAVDQLLQRGVVGTAHAPVAALAD